MAERIDPRVRAQADMQTMVPVFLVLTEQPQGAILERARALSNLKNQAAEERYRRTLQSDTASAEEVRQARAGLDAITLAMRQEAFREIEAEIGPQQAAVESRLQGLGATRIGRYNGINMLTAEVPSGALAALEADSAIARVWPVEKLQALIVNSVPAIGAPTFWTNGYTGAGESVAVLDSGVRTNHPAFAGKTINSQVFLSYGSTDPCFADNASSPQDLMGHGTHVAGIVMSQGSMEGSINWTHYQGVAKGIDALYNLKIGYLIALTQACSGETTEKLAVADMRDVADALDWLVANSPASVVNLSYGLPTNTAGDLGAQMFDYYTDTYDLSAAIAAGNSGTDYADVSTPSIAYNVLSVGNWDTGGLPNNSHEVMNPTTSTGPTEDYRQKPDIAAPGTNIYSTAYDWDGNGGANPDFVPHTGTSMSAPHIAGALALLRSALPATTEAGPIAKAILINSADTPNYTPWQPDRGFGYANMSTAWNQRTLYDIASLGGAAGAPTFKLYTVPLSGERYIATAVWNRHMYGPSVDSTGMPSYTSWTASGLAMTLFYEASGSVIPPATPQALGTVEKLSADLTAPHTAYGILNVTWQPGQTVVAEQIAVAFSSTFTPATGPALTLSCSIPATLYVGAPFAVACSTSNTGDMSAVAVSGGAALSNGFSQNSQLSFGDVQPGQNPVAGQMSLNAPAVAGDYNVTVSVNSTVFGGQFSASTTVAAHVVPNAAWAPWLGSVGPAWVSAGGSDFQLSVTGANFFPASTVYWNGIALATTFVDNTQLTATVPASLIAVPITASVTVVNPSGISSVSRSLAVRPPVWQTPTTISLFAGCGSNCGVNSYTGDGHPAVNTILSNPYGVVADSAGNVYIADAGDNRVRRVGPDGVIWTVAGNGQYGFSGDGGPATAASLYGPADLAIDAQGNLYIADMGNKRIRKVTRGGIISTYAGNGGSGPGPDGGQAASTAIGDVRGLAVDQSGNLYFSNDSCFVKNVNPQGIISTYAGIGTYNGIGDPDYTGDGGPAVSAQLNNPYGVVVDTAGNLFIADSGNLLVRVVNAAGIISAFAGGGNSYPGDGGLATAAYLWGPVSLALDAAGNLYLLQGPYAQLRVSRVSTDGIISTYAGGGFGTASGDGGPAVGAA